MRTLWRQTRSFLPAVRLLMANQFAINLAFYMQMPYLAAHLSDGVGLAAWRLGLWDWCWVYATSPSRACFSSAVPSATRSRSWRAVCCAPWAARCSTGSTISPPLLGPLVGLALLAADFRLVCTTVAAVFAALTVLQRRRLPVRPGPTQGTARRDGVLSQWRTVAANRSFLLFTAAMIGSYVPTYQAGSPAGRRPEPAPV